MSPPPTTLLLLLIIFIFTQLSASSPNNLGRRILHQQPFFPQSNNSAPPPPPPLPFTTAASSPSATPFFPSLPSPPPPPFSNFASFPANVSSINVLKSHSSSSPKLLILTVLLLLLALVLSFFAVYFFIYKKRRRSQSGCFTKDGKATDHSSTSSSKQQQPSRNHGNSTRTNPDSNVNSRNSSDFLYLGTLVNNQNSRGYDNPRLIVNKNILNVHSSNASSRDASSRKWDSPDLNPLPPLSRNSNIPITTEVGSSWHTFVVSNNSNVSNTSSRYDAVDAEEEFYSPRGSLGGGGDSVETRSSSRRDLNAVDNFDGKKFSSSSSRSSSSSSSSDSPARSVSISISPPVSLSPIRPKSPELVEMDVLLARPPLIQPQQEQPTFMVGLESASDEDGASLSSLSSKKSALDSARTSNQSDGNVVVGLNGFQNLLDCDSKSSSFSSAEKDPVDCLSGLDGNVRSQAQMPQPLTTQLGRDSKSSSSSSPERDPADSVRGSSDDNERSHGQLLQPVITQLESDRESSFSFSPEREVNELPKIPDASDHIHNVMTLPQVLHPFMTPLESHSKLSFTLSPERNRIESPRTSNASDYYVKSPSRILSPDGKPLISLSPERNHIELSRISDVSGRHVKSVRSPSRTSDPNHQHRQPIPLPPPLPPPFSAGIQWESHTPSPSPNATVPLGRPPALITPSRPFEVHSPSDISPFELPTPNCRTAEKTEDTTNIKTLETMEETVNSETPGKDTDALKHESSEKSEHTPKPKLKTLHWDKVKANSDREMVWDQLKCSSFKLNEEMIETLFVVNNKSPNPKEAAGHPVFPSPKQESNRVLDPKKSQNIAISLRALNVTIEEVHEALVEGNVDLLGTELLESLQKMAPTKEEERKLKEYSDDLPFKLGPAERFLKAVLDIPFAFKRVDAMLYVANFDSEVEYLKKSFETLEAACEELRNSRMFLKLLEAVLKTGNRMNVGTNRGDAHAFKLDTLLKLVDVKGADGKTTLLHFVVQEIIKAEGTRLSTVNQGLMSAFNEDAKCRKLGLQVVSSLSSDLSNVKKAAAMDSEVLSSEVTKLSRGIEHIREIVQLNKTNEKEENSSKFAESMDKFISTAEEEIIRIQAQESVALSLVKEITEYFHGNSAKEEAHPFRIFMVVRDFLSILDRVCKEVGTVNERTMISSAHKFPVPVNPMLPATLHGTPAKQQFSSPYNYDSSSP